MGLNEILFKAIMQRGVPGIGGQTGPLAPNPLQTMLNVQPPTVGNAQPNYDFQGGQSGPDMNNPYVPEIQKLLQQLEKTNAELKKSALAASAHQRNVPTQNPNPIRPGANLLGAGIGILGEILTKGKGGGARGYQNFVQGAQNTEQVRVQNEMNKYKAQGAADQGVMDALKIEAGGIQDQIQGQVGLSRQFDDQFNKSVMNDYRQAQIEGLNERAAAKNAMDALELQVKNLLADLKVRDFNEIKTPESQVKIAKTLQDIENAKEKAKTEVQRRAKIDAEISGIKSRAKLTGAQTALVDKKVANYDDEFKARVANIYSQISKRAVDARKVEGKTGDTVSLNQRRIMLQAVISVGNAQLKQMGSPMSNLARWTEIAKDVQDAQNELRNMGKVGVGGAMPRKAQPRAMGGNLPKPQGGGVTLPPGAKRVG